MTKRSLLKEIAKYPYDVDAFHLIESANSEQLKRLGLAVMWIISPRITKKSNFLRDYSEAFDVSETLETKDKIMGDLLYKSLQNNPNLTCAEFLRMNS